MDIASGLRGPSESLGTAWRKKNPRGCLSGVLLSCLLLELHQEQSLSCAVDAKNFLLTPCLVLPGPLWILQGVIGGVHAPGRAGAGIPLLGVLALHGGRVEVNALA